MSFYRPKKQCRKLVFYLRGFLEKVQHQRNGKICSVAGREIIDQSRGRGGKGTFQHTDVFIILAKFKEESLTKLRGDGGRRKLGYSGQGGMGSTLE